MEAAFAVSRPSSPPYLQSDLITRKLDHFARDESLELLGDGIAVLPSKQMLEVEGCGLEVGVDLLSSAIAHHSRSLTIGDTGAE